MDTDLLKRGALATVLAAAANVLLAMAARRVLDLPAAFQQVTPGPVIFLTVVGGIAATLVYWQVLERSQTPRATFLKIAAAALVVSWVPDLLLPQSGLPGVTWTGVAVLMVLHVVAAAVIVAVLTRGAAGAS